MSPPKISSGDRSGDSRCPCLRAEYKVKVRARYNNGGPGDWSGVATITVAESQ